MTPSQPIRSRPAARRARGTRRLALQDRHAAFLARLAGPRRSQRPLPPLALTLRRLRSAARQGGRPMHLATHWTWNNTTVQSPRAAAAAPLPRPLLLPTQLTARLSTHHHVARGLQRLIERMQTVIVTAARVDKTLRVEQRLIYPRLPLPLTRPVAGPAPLEDHRPPGAVEATVPVDGRSRQRPSASARAEAIALAPQELSRVTDHVIRVLDQRVLSYRERTGRI